ncbi:MAG: hypothetical protein WAT53_00980, partial [Nitrosomonas sp.]
YTYHQHYENDEISYIHPNLPGPLIPDYASLIQPPPAFYVDECKIPDIYTVLGRLFIPLG